MRTRDAPQVILLDSDWNPHADAQVMRRRARRRSARARDVSHTTACTQAVARAHRIGQSKPVRVVRLITAKSVEEVVLRYASAVTGAVMAVA